MGTTNFKDCIFLSGASFMEVKFDRKVDFENTSFQDIVSFMDAGFGGESLSFMNVYFAGNEDQEAACIKAKKLLDNNGKEMKRIIISIEKWKQEGMEKGVHIDISTTKHFFSAIM
jgi:hypothetical protein